MCCLLCSTLSKIYLLAFITCSLVYCTENQRRTYLTLIKHQRTVIVEQEVKNPFCWKVLPRCHYVLVRNDGKCYQVPARSWKFSISMNLLWTLFPDKVFRRQCLSKESDWRFCTVSSAIYYSWALATEMNRGGGGGAGGECCACLCVVLDRVLFKTQVVKEFAYKKAIYTLRLC